MNIIGCDLHPCYRVVAWVNTSDGEIKTPRLEHENGEAEAFYRSLPAGAMVGIEASLPLPWFERLLAACGHELWVLLVEAAQSAARWDEELRRDYRRWKYRKVSAVAQGAIARKLAVRLYWMLRQQVDYAQLVRMSGSPCSGVVDTSHHPSRD